MNDDTQTATPEVELIPVLDTLPEHSDDPHVRASAQNETLRQGVFQAKDVDYYTLRIQHTSLQFSDGPKQKASDVDKVFRRGKDVLTGTESGEDPLSTLILKAAKKYGYRIHRWRGNWVAIRKRIIEPGSWRRGHVFVASTKDVHGPGHDSGFPWVSFIHRDYGDRIAVAGGHYPTKGRKPGDPNYQITKQYAKKLGAWARHHGKGYALAFYGGDQNILDNKMDTFRGEPLRTAWDELKVWPSTGHGCIDVIASYNGDNRTKAVRARAYNDKQLHLYSDHFLIEADYRITKLRRK